MAKVQESIEINAPVEKVFAFVTSPENWTRYVTSLQEVRDLSSGEPATGTTFVWSYRMFGMTFNGTGKITEFIPNEKFAMTMEGSMPITETYAFSNDGSKTTLDAEIEYDMPGRVGSFIANTKVAESLNAKESRMVLERIKVLCEEA